MMTVAVLDDGVFQRAVGELAFDLAVDIYGGIVTNALRVPMDSHGSLCAAIIRRYAPSVSIGSIKVLDEHLTGPVGHLCAALRWCVENDVPVVHLSVGSPMPQDAIKLYSVIEEVLAAGTIVVAAQRNEGGFSLPAQLPGVIGVRADANLTGDAYRLRSSPHQGIQIAASSCHCVQLGNCSISTPVTNSYAAPLISAKVAIFLEKGVDPYTGLSLDTCAALSEKGALPASLYPDELHAYTRNSPSADIPVVHFVGNDALARIGKEFGMQLLERGYLPLPVTGEERYRQYGYLHTDGKDIAETGLYMAAAHDADVLLAAFSRLNRDDDLIDCPDILVEWDPSGEQLKITSDYTTALCDIKEVSDYLFNLLLA